MVQYSLSWVPTVPTTLAGRMIDFEATSRCYVVDALQLNTNDEHGSQIGGGHGKEREEVYI